MASMGKRVAVAFPDTILEERDTLRDKTVKLGQIARACAIYGVDVVEVFPDVGRRGESAFIRKVLEYLETPQYLRRRIYPIDESLKFAGLLPPLRIPSHKPRVSLEDLGAGEVREGVTNGDGTVDIGLEVSPRLRDVAEANRRVTVRVVTKTPFEAVLAKRETLREYWGYQVETKRLDDVLSDSRFDLKIATSRLGDPLASHRLSLSDAVRRAQGVMLIFGSPARGLFDIVGPGLRKRAGYVLNIFAEQHVETVRTEEAMFAALNLVTSLSA